MKRPILAALAVALMATSSQAAEFKWWKINTPDIYGIKITGDIDIGDKDKFADTLKDLLQKNSVKPTNMQLTVHLNSNGGSVADAIDIGSTIQKYHFNTFVNKEVNCASSCALIWIAGNRRYVHAAGHIGFHEAFRRDTKKTSSSGNAVVGAYLGSLGFPYGTIAYLTSAPSDKMEWLSAAKAKELGIAALTCDDHRCSYPYSE